MADTLTIPTSSATQFSGPVAATRPATSHVSVFEIDELLANRLSTRYARWVRLFTQDSQAPITLHPDHVLIELSRLQQRLDAPGWIVKGTHGAQVTGLAALLPKQLRADRIVGGGPRWTLDGYRLVGSTALGFEGPADQRQMVDHLLDWFCKTTPDFLMVEDLEEGSPLWNQFHLAQGRGIQIIYPQGVQPRHRVRFGNDPAAYWEKFSSSSRKTHRRTLKRLEPCRVERVTQPDQVERFLADVRQVSAQSWQQRHIGPRLNDDAGTHMLFQFLAEQGALRSYVLYHNERPIAFEIGTQHSNVYVSEEGGYDLEFAKLSPGQALQVRLLEDLVEERTPEYYDFGGGDADYKQHFSNNTTQSGTILLFSPGFRTNTLAKYLQSGMAANRAIRWMLAETGLRTFFRRRVRR